MRASMVVDSPSGMASVPFVVRRARVRGVTHPSPAGRAMPRWISMSWSGRGTCRPAVRRPDAEIIDLLGEVGDWVRLDPDGVMAALESLVEVSAAAARPLGTLLRGSVALRQPVTSRLPARAGTRRLDVLDSCGPSRYRAQPPRRSPLRSRPRMGTFCPSMPGCAAITSVRSALVTVASLLKMASHDLFTAPRCLRAVSAVAPGHPPSGPSPLLLAGGRRRGRERAYAPEFFDKLRRVGRRPVRPGAAR